MKKSSLSKEIVMPTLSLFLICLVVTLLLGLTDKVTAPKIRELADERERQTRLEVLGAAQSFSDARTCRLGDTEYAYYEGVSDEKTVGWVFGVSTKSYGGEAKLMVGVDTEGKVTGVSILQINDTPGLGMNARDESFLGQYKGRSGTVGVAKNSPSENEIQALTGATITSRAMTQAVNTALALYSEIGGESVG